MSLRHKFFIAVIFSLLLEALLILAFYNFFEKHRDTQILKIVAKTENIVIRCYHDSTDPHEVFNLIKSSLDTMESIEAYSFHRHDGEIIGQYNYSYPEHEHNENTVKRLGLRKFRMSTNLGMDHHFDYIININFQIQDYLFVLLIFLVIVFLVYILYRTFNILMLKKLKRMITLFESVKNQNNYSLRLENGSKDEIGSLYNSFNSLISQIEEDNIVQLRSEARLNRAKESAEESDRLKSAFLANMSHEIRTPMNSILGFSELLAKKTNDEDKRDKFIELIQSSSKSLLSLISNIIDISKIEVNQLEVKYKNVNINELFEEVFHLFGEDKDLMLNENVKLLFNIPDTTVNYFTDPFRLKQILSNLLSNAIKFTEKGVIEFGFAKSGKTISIYVKDSGKGIPGEYLNNIFDHFHKVEIDEKKLYRGAGLGLSITKSIVELLGGEISVESRLNRGSKFIIVLQAYESDNGENIQESKTAINFKDLKNKTILIAEDDEINYMFLEEILYRKNVKTIWVQNGEQAISVCKKRPDIDIVIMDLNMPIMSGFTAAEKIKQIIPKLPIIALTAMNIESKQRKEMSRDFSDFLTKPVNAEKLFTTIQKFLI